MGGRPNSEQDLNSQGSPWETPPPFELKFFWGGSHLYFCFAFCVRATFVEVLLSSSANREPADGQDDRNPVAYENIVSYRVKLTTDPSHTNPEHEKALGDPFSQGGRRLEMVFPSNPYVPSAADSFGLWSARPFF